MLTDKQAAVCKFCIEESYPTFLRWSGSYLPHFGNEEAELRVEERPAPSRWPVPGCDLDPSLSDPNTPFRRGGSKISGPTSVTINLAVLGKAILGPSVPHTPALSLPQAPSAWFSKYVHREPSLLLCPHCEVASFLVSGPPWPPPSSSPPEFCQLLFPESLPRLSQDKWRSCSQAYTGASFLPNLTHLSILLPTTTGPSFPQPTSPNLFA